MPDGVIYGLLGILSVVVGAWISKPYADIRKLQRLEKLCRRAGTSLDELLDDTPALEWGIAEAMRVGLSKSMNGRVTETRYGRVVIRREEVEE